MCAAAAFDGGGTPARRKARAVRPPRTAVAGLGRAAPPPPAAVEAGSPPQRSAAAADEGWGAGLGGAGSLDGGFTRHGGEAGPPKHLRPVSFALREHVGGRALGTPVSVVWLQELLTGPLMPSGV